MNLPLAPIAAAGLGIVAALAVAVLPGSLIEGLVLDSGLPSVIAAAEPPLGLTARIGLAADSGLLVAAFSWLTLFVFVGTRAISVGARAPVNLVADEPVAPVLRRADAHPDAPPRPPLLATRDLGTPFLEIRKRPEPAPEPAPTELEVLDLDPLFAAKAVTAEVHELRPAPPAAAPPPLTERPLPEDFDQPLAAFDPAAIPAKPIPQPVPLAPLAPARRPPIFDETERFEVFELTPPVRRPAPRPARILAPYSQTPPAVPAAVPPAEPIVRPETDASVHALLERLERGVVRRGYATRREETPKEAERGLEEALVTLRNLARRTA